MKTYPLQCFQFLNNEISIQDFEQYIYEDEQLESLIGADQYMDLLAFDFTQENAVKHLKELLKKTINITDWNQWRITNLIEALLNDPDHYYTHLQKIASLYYKEDIQELNYFGALESAVEDVLPNMDIYRERVVAYAEKFLNEIQ